MNCHGCDGYRPAKLTRFHELDDDTIDNATIDELRRAYRELRTHHIEEMTALWTKLAEDRTQRSR